MQGTARVCAADGCWRRLDLTGKRPHARWCSDSCRKRQHYRDRHGLPGPTCAAEGCENPLPPYTPGVGRRAKYCTERCRRRQNRRDRVGSFPVKRCAQCDRRFRACRPLHRFCRPECQRRWWRENDDAPLPAYWRQYLERFDRAIRERTEDAWAACHEMAPVGSGRPDIHDGSFDESLADLLGILVP